MSKIRKTSLSRTSRFHSCWTKKKKAVMFSAGWTETVKVRGDRKRAEGWNVRGAEEDWSQKAVIYQRMGRRFRAAYRHEMICHITGSWATQPLCQHRARA